MSERNITSLRAMMANMSTDQLDELLDAELKREPVDADAVRLIFRVLKDRENLHTGENTEKQNTVPPKKKSKTVLGGLRAASLAAACMILVMMMPWRANAGYFYRMISNWTDKFLEIFSTEGPDSFFVTYAYATENEELQTVHSTAVAEDILKPTVPMWIPEGYRLEAFDVEQLPEVTTLRASFGDAVEAMTLTIERHVDMVTFYPDSEVTVHERHGVAHYIFRENEMWTVVWTNENIICTLRADCEEDVLMKIIDSVYSLENI